MKAPTLPISSRTVDFDPDEKTEESQKRRGESLDHSYLSANDHSAIEAS
jgi:hypothetical protein